MSGELTNIASIINNFDEYGLEEMVNALNIKQGVAGYTTKTVYSKYGDEKGNLRNANMRKNFGGGQNALEDYSDIDSNDFYTMAVSGSLLLKPKIEKYKIGELYKFKDNYTNSLRNIIDTTRLSNFERELRNRQVVQTHNTYTELDTKFSFLHSVIIHGDLKGEGDLGSSQEEQLEIKNYVNFGKLKEYCSNLKIEDNGIFFKISKDYTQRGFSNVKHIGLVSKLANWTFYTSPEKPEYYSIEEKHVPNTKIQPREGKFSSQNQLTGKRDYSFYEEADYEGGSGEITSSDGIGSTESTIRVGAGTSDIIRNTNNLFKEIKTNTLINRFHTNLTSDDFKDNELISSFSKYGLSRGRNLLRKDAEEGTNTEKVEGYDNPYCRVWTALHQYNKLSRRIRPFYNGDVPMSISETQSEYGGLRPNGSEYLENNTVLTRQGFVRISPSEEVRDVKKCMFSIENLAWRDVINAAGLSQEQIGPFGGRIMWFPPYNLRFNENVSVEWSASKFIGRGEQIYTYTNTDRNGTLSFTLLIDHPAILNKYSGANAERQKEVENDILRFFAGCGNLVGSYDGSANNKTPGDYQKENANPKLKKKSHEIAIVAFYPNNWSGKNFMDNIPGGQEKLMTYETTTNSDECFGAVNGVPTTDIDTGSTVFGNHDCNKSLFDLNKFEEHETVTVDGVSYNVKEKIRERLFSDKGEDFEFYSVFGPSGVTHLKSLVTDNSIFGYENKNEGNIKFKLDVIDVFGAASSHGKNNDSGNVKNNALSKNRTEFLKELCILNSASITKESFGEYQEHILAVQDDNLDTSIRDINTIEAKIARCAYVVFNVVEDGETKAVASKEEDESFVLQDYGEENKTSGETNSAQEVMNVETEAAVNDGYTADNEYKYFREVRANEMVYKYIAEKVKYFDPAFHSITPEGFNSRLTFLHQCTRQGPTVDLSSGNIDSESKDYLKYAGNLSFGRPPYCILRIGDFFHTKICITSLSISYDTGNGIQWDLNQEGIGVQPMYANVDISFNFIGGQDLAGPIERLQNAVTSNYYANASVYDSKADIRGSKIYSPVIDTPMQEQIIYDGEEEQETSQDELDESSKSLSEFFKKAIETDSTKDGSITITRVKE